MLSVPYLVRLLLVSATLLIAWDASAQSFRLQCPKSTALHPNGLGPDGSRIKCQQVSGGDGFVTMGDGTQVYLFGFGPLSGLNDIYNGLPGTQTPDVFNVTLPEPYLSAFLNPSSAGPSTLIGMPDAGFLFNGAIGLAVDQTSEQVRSIGLALNGLGIPVPGTGYHKDDPVVLIGGSYTTPATAKVASVNPATGAITSIAITNPGNGYTSTPVATVTRTSGSGTNAELDVTMQLSGEITGAVDPRQIMDVGVMNASQPAPLIAIDEDDELFLTLTNVGQIMRPDLFEQHTVHFHGYPNASSFYDGVPDASVAINIGGSFTYYYLAPDAGTYFWHCHISPPEHLQMGMVGQLYVRPRQNRVAAGSSLRAALVADQSDLRKASKCESDILCSTPLPPANNVKRAADPTDSTKPRGGYAYNDGDGSTYYDVEYPIQMMGFDPNFHFVGMTFNPESFTDIKDKYFLLNGRSYPDTVNPGPLQTQSTDGTLHTSQPMSTVINIPAGGKALLRISDLNVSEYHTLASLGIPMRVIALNARLLRDTAGNDMTYLTNSITLGGGESLDVILDASAFAPPGAGPRQKFYLYTPQLDHLSNDAENFGGMMTEVNVCNAVDPKTKVCS
jgi:FtsP/CotA-like multicopper oxidase with cupredoxin domain